MLQALRFRSGSPDLLRSLSSALYGDLLAFTDRTQLTLALGLRWSLPDLPSWLGREIAVRQDKNTLRHEKLSAIYREIASALDSHNLEFTLLKGFSSCPDCCPDPRSRVQYDIDLLFSPEEAERARDILIPLGYESLASGDSTPTDHLPTLLRKEPWQWRGDYFALDLPVSVDLHFRLWDAATEAIEVPGLSEFRSRTQVRTLDGVTFKALARPDALAYAALHMLRHLLRGSLRPGHGWELAWFLQHTHSDRSFWLEWKLLHPSGLRSLQALCFLLVHLWYDCALPSEVRDELETLPREVTNWVDEFGYSPLYSLHRSNKDELWLHLALVQDRASRLRVIRRRLLPLTIPGHVSTAYLSSDKRTVRLLIQAHLERTRYMARRAVHHFCTLIAFAAGALRWKSGLPAPFWRYFAAAACFDVGLFAFFLLYNIYLLQIGFTERLAGYISAAMTSGSLVGSFLAAFVIARWDVRKCLKTTLCLIAVITAGRAILTQALSLILLASLSGAAMSIWAVCIAPTVAALTPERSRPRAFSFIFAAGIGLGVVGGLAGGNLPEVLQQSAGSRTAALRVSLLLSCCPVIVAAFLLRRLPRVQAAGGTQAPFRLTPFLRKYLLAIALWHLGTGSFNPFFNAFLTRLGYGVSRIGAIFSVSQATQTLAVLAAPFVLRKLGLTRGIAAMEAATALFALCLTLTTQSAGVIAAYAAYMACQYMSEPGMNSLLMDSVSDEERGGASALNFSVAFAAQAIASSVAGTAIPRIGYANVLSVAAMLCFAAAIAFYFLGRQPVLSRTSVLQPASETDPTGIAAPTRDERSS